MTDTGIDYGMGTANRDAESGIRYGCISVQSLSGDVCSDAQPIYADSCECPDCGMEWTAETEDGAVCECGDLLSNLGEDVEPIGYDYSPNDSDYATEYSEILCSVFVTRSPFYTYGAFCSPCAPGAVDLDSPMAEESGIRAYCFGHDWFEEGVAPYRVWRISNDEEVIAGQEVLPL